MTLFASRFASTSLVRRRPLALLIAATSVFAVTACSTTDTSDLDPNAGNVSTAGAGGGRAGNGGGAGKAGGGGSSAGGSVAGGSGGSGGGGSGGSITGGASGSVAGGFAGAVAAGSGGADTAGAAGTLSAGFGGFVTGGAAGSTAAGAAGSGTGTGGAVVAGGSAGSTSAGAGGQAAQAGAAGEGGSGGQAGDTSGGGSAGTNAGGNAGTNAGGNAGTNAGGNAGTNAGGNGGSSGAGANAGSSGAGGDAGQAGAGGGTTGKTVVVRTQHYDGAPSAGVRVRLNDKEMLSNASGEATFDDVTLPYTMYYNAGPESGSLIQRVITRGFTDLTELAPVVRTSQNPKNNLRPKVTYVVKATTGAGVALTVGQSICITTREPLGQSQCTNVVAGGGGSLTIALAQQAQPAIVYARSAINGGGDLVGALRVQLSGQDGDSVPLSPALETPTGGAFKPSVDLPAGYTASGATLTGDTDDGLAGVSLTGTGSDASLASINKQDFPWLKLRFQLTVNGPDAGTSATFTRNGVDDLLGAKATFPQGAPTFTLPGGGAKLGVGGVVTLGGAFEDKILIVRSQGAGGNIQDDPRHRWLIVRTKRSAYTLPVLENFQGKWQAGDPGYVSVQGLAPNTPLGLINIAVPPPDGVTWQVQRTITIE